MSPSSSPRPALAPDSDLVRGVDLAVLGTLPGLAAAFVAGRDRDLLAPLRYLPAGELPLGDPPSVNPRRVDRGRLAQGLAAANRAYGHRQAEQLAAKLADPRTRVVVTGQQPGLFGGPLLSFSKALAAARWAAALEAAGEPAVAVFWVATEDHDWAEVATATVPAPDGPRTVTLGPDPAPLVPLGARSFGPEVEPALAELAALPGGPSYAAFWQQVGQWYRPSSRFGEAFPRLLVHLLGERAPLFLDSQLPELKAAERPYLTGLVERRAEIETALRAADERITARGHRLQVAPQPGLSPLFLLEGGQRRRVEWHGDGEWSLRGSAGGRRPVAELLAIVADNPLIVSPGVLARPAIQDAVLGSTLQIMGPGELSYMAQVAAVYPVLGIAAPWTTLRPQAVVLEERHLGWLADLGLSLAQLLGDPGGIDRALAARQGTDVGAPLVPDLERGLDALRERALTLDPNLEAPYRKTRETIDRALQTFADKLAASASRADETARKRIDQVRAQALPAGELQERRISTGHFPARYGERFVDAFWEQLDLDPARLQVVRV